MRWLAEKDIAISEDPGCLEADGARATIETIKNGIQELLFCQLVEETRAGRFTTEIHASTDGWINISVRSAERRFVSVPRIAKALMRRLDLYDASLQLLDKPMVWDIDKIDDLIELLEDDDRHGLVFVAGSGKGRRRTL